MIIFRFIAGQLAPLTLLGAILAYFQPDPFDVFDTQFFGLKLFLWMFAVTMFALGLVLEPAELSETAREPGKIAAGLMTQYTVMPALGFCAAYFGGLPPELALGFVIVACAPGAMASNVIVYLAGGAVAFSIALTTVATIISPLLTPVLVKWLGGAFLPIPFWPLMFTIIKIVLIPLLLGILFRRFLGRYVGVAKELAPAVAALAIIIICSYAVAKNQLRISELFSASEGVVVISLVILLNALGYIAGWFLAKIYRFDLKHRLTLSIEIGMQNAGLGVALALEHFKPETALPGALFAFWCVLTAAGASSWLRHRRKKCVAD